MWEDGIFTTITCPEVPQNKGHYFHPTGLLTSNPPCPSTNSYVCLQRYHAWYNVYQYLPVTYVTTLKFFYAGFFPISKVKDFEKWIFPSFDLGVTWSWWVLWLLEEEILMELWPFGIGRGAKSPKKGVWSFYVDHMHSSRILLWSLFSAKSSI